MRNTRSSPTPSSQAKCTRLYNESLINIEKSFALNPEKIFSIRINRWLNHQFDVRLLDQGALSWYLVNTVAHLCSDVFVYRNNRESIPNNLYSFLVCGSAFGKSAFYRHFSNAISICPIHNEIHINQGPPNAKETTKNIIESSHFVDEMSRGGLMKQLSQCDKIVLLDEADGCLKRNGLIPDGPIGEHNNVYETVLTLYAGRATVTKSLTNSTTNLHLKKLTVLANTTEEPILRLLKKKISGDAPNPFAERSLFLFINTPLTLEQPFPPRWDYHNEPTIHQVAFTASQLNNLDFYYETTARLMTIAYGNLLCKLMIKNEKIDKWLTARLGKSREHLHRLAINLQLVQLIFDLIDKYQNNFGNLNHGLNDSIFQQRMKHIIDEFLGRNNDQIRIKLEIRLSIAKSAIQLLNLLIHQYLCIFGNDSVYLTTENSQMTENDQYEFDTTTTSVATAMPASTDQIDQTSAYEKSIKDLAKNILLFEDIVFTKTRLSHSIRAWKNNANIHEATIKLLEDKKLIKYYGKEVKHVNTQRIVHIWLKSVPISSDLTNLNEFQASLLEFKIQFSEFQSKLVNCRRWTDVIISSNLANLLKSSQYQPYIKFDVDSLTIVPNNGNINEANEEQNNVSLNFDISNTSYVMNSTTTDASLSSSFQSSSQLNSLMTLVSTDTSVSSGTNILAEIPVQQTAVFNQAPSSSIASTAQFCLPRPMDLAKTRSKQSATNKSRANKNKQIQSDK